MSKILRNLTSSTVVITDIGQSVPANGQLTIDPSDYDKYAGSSNTVTLVGNATLVVNDGSYDLAISSGIDLIKGLFPSKVNVNVVGGNNSLSAHVLDSGGIYRLAVDSVFSPKGFDANKLLSIGFGAAITSPAWPSVKPLGIYVVPNGKQFKMVGVMCKTAAVTTYFSVMSRKTLWKWSATALTIPGAPTLTAKTYTGWTAMGLGLYRYRVTAVNNIGETAGGTEASITLTGAQNGVALSWTAVPNALYYKVYRTASNGNTGTQKLLASTDITTYTDINPDSEISSTSVPTSGTTSGHQEGVAYPANYASTFTALDVLVALSASASVDMLYKNIYGERRVVNFLPTGTVGSQTIIPIQGLTNPADNRRIPNDNAARHYWDAGVQDILHLSTNATAGAFTVYGFDALFHNSCEAANTWCFKAVPNAIVFQAGQEIIFGTSANAAVTVAARSDMLILGTLEDL